MTRRWTLRCALCGAVLAGALLCACATSPPPSAPELYYLLELDEGPNAMLRLPRTIGRETFAGAPLPPEARALPPQVAPGVETPVGDVGAVVSFAPMLEPAADEAAVEDGP